MCGIVGYAGNKNVESVLVVALLSLEYRGYDSAGIAVIDNSELLVRKQAGKIRELESFLREYPVRGKAGIGHTRWATHGEPTQVNAHPHTDSQSRVAVVHNGIIENYLELRQQLKKNGHVFHSQTDSEVLPHLLEEALSRGKNFSQAMLDLFGQIEGKWAFSAINDKEPEKVYFAQDGAPLLIGKGQNEFFLASDVSPLTRNCKEVYYVKPGQWGYFTASECKLYNFEGDELELEFIPQEVQWQDVDKGPYPHYMIKEINEQPGIFRKIIQERMGDDGHIHFPELALSKDVLSRVNRIIIQAAGTSLYSGMIGKHYLEHFAKIQTDTETSSEFRYRNPVIEGDTVIMGISQSGETADTLAAIHEAKAKFLKVISLVNNANSTIARESDSFLRTEAGPEIGVASTKAFTAQLLNLIFFALYLGEIKWLLSDDEKTKILEEIRLLPNKMEQILQKSHLIESWAQELAASRDFVFLGRTYNHPVALEGALKLKEISYIHASGYAGGEFKHGPIALITNEVPVVCLATKSDIYSKMISNIQEIKARSGIILSIVTEGDTEAKDLSDYCFEMPECPEILSPILNVIPLQLLAYYMALAKGCPPDQPRNLAKSVTVE